MRKKQKTDEHDNTDRWVVSYADFITLLFAFFTTMYAISHVDLGKLEKFEGSMRSAFKSDGVQSSDQIIDGIAPINPDAISVEKEFREAISALDAKDDIEVRKDDRGVIISLGDSILFEAGQAVIKKSAVSTLTAIGSTIQRLPNKVIIEGHTDNLPIKGPGYTLNWDLSIARATIVLRYLLDNYNIYPARFSVAGYAEFRPAYSNSTPEGRARNRRVDFVVLNVGKTEKGRR